MLCAAAAAVAAEGRFAMKTAAEVIGVSRSNLIERMRERPKKRIIAELPPMATAVSTPSSSAKRWPLA